MAHGATIATASATDQTARETTGRALPTTPAGTVPPESTGFLVQASARPFRVRLVGKGKTVTESSPCSSLQQRVPRALHYNRGFPVCLHYNRGFPVCFTTTEGSPCASLQQRVPRVLHYNRGFPVCFTTTEGFGPHWRRCIAPYPFVVCIPIALLVLWGWHRRPRRKVRSFEEAPR
jgi:hypothetical protein